MCNRCFFKKEPQMCKRCFCIKKKVKRCVTVDFIFQKQAEIIVIVASLVLLAIYCVSTIKFGGFADAARKVLSLNH